MIKYIMYVCQDYFITHDELDAAPEPEVLLPGAGLAQLHLRSLQRGGVAVRAPEGAGPRRVLLADLVSQRPWFLYCILHLGRQ
jgi:hypothetical protein